MELLLLYLKQRRRGILIWGLLCLLFGVSFALYRLPMEAVLYPISLCAFLSILLFFWDLGRVRKKHQQLVQIKERGAALLSQLPPADGVEERDYQAIVRMMQAEQVRLQTDMTARYAEMIDYYTVWAHQIKTPIASMGLTLQGEDSPLARKLSSDLLRIEQYVEMVLAFLRLDAASTDYVIRMCDLDSVIRTSVKRFAGDFIRKKIRLEYEPIHETVVTDEKWLGFVLEQILSNALKYTRTGSVKIYLKPPKTLCVQDTGIGIAKEDLPRIFEKGYTGYNGRLDRKASGLGLSLCKQVCKGLGHTITARSVPDQGTVIELNLEQYQSE
jgi:signal transduction histidine kinase